MTIIGHIKSDYGEKFAVPRQSGLVKSSREQIIFEKSFQNPDYIRGIEEFSHLWILWQFSKIEQDHYSATVRPPRLGGNTRKGVFATRSPFRPNHIGLSCVKLLEVRMTDSDGPVLIISGGDMVDGTPVLDIKPYLPYADAHIDASGGFSDDAPQHLSVKFPHELMELFETEKRQALLEVLAQDPRPMYQNDPDRIYGFLYAGRNVRFYVKDDVLTVISCEEAR